MVICSFFSSTSFAADEVSEMISAINAINIKSLGTVNSGNCTESSTEMGFSNTFLNRPSREDLLMYEQKIQFNCPLTVASVCEKVAKSCNALHSNNRNPYERITPSNPIRYKDDLVYTHQGCMNQHTYRSETDQKLILQQAAKIFYNLTLEKNKTSLTHICCEKGLNPSQMETCQREFQNTRLIIVDSNQMIWESSRDHKGEFVRVSTTSLNSCLNQECIESFFFHELGHSCHRSRRVAKENHYATYEKCDEMIQAESEYSSITEELSSCLKDRLERFAIQEEKFEKMALGSEKDNHQVCLASWKGEAYANAIFVKKRNSFAHLAHSCNAMQDRLHAQPKVYLDCLLDTPDAKNNFCPANTSNQ